MTPAENLKPKTENKTRLLAIACESTGAPDTRVLLSGARE